ncbi:MAG: hypothetical protein A2428_06315 [Bdellovibrionales bacterium RIFOXYC1_FULL_54_43]|nr:MAG: hypothetical protein A2428_06315 [Bdellovibrionales bacterium RIFOXYC1_FULL_54_43]
MPSRIIFAKNIVRIDSQFFPTPPAEWWRTPQRSGPFGLSGLAPLFSNSLFRELLLHKKARPSARHRTGRSRFASSLLVRCPTSEFHRDTQV